LGYINLVRNFLILLIFIKYITSSPYLFAESYENEFSSRINRIIASASDTCVGDGAVFFLRQGAVTNFDFNNDGTTDLTVLDEQNFECSLGASWFHGSGGSEIHLLTKTEQISVLAKDYKIMEQSEGDYLILVKFHGSACGEPNFVPCWQAISTFEGRFIRAR